MRIIAAVAAIAAAAAYWAGRSRACLADITRLDTARRSGYEEGRLDGYLQGARDRLATQDT